MPRQPRPAQQRIAIWLLRTGFFAVGAFLLVPVFRGSFFGPHGPIQGTLLIMLSFLVSAVVRQRRAGWALLTLTAVCALLPLVGLGLIFGLGGGNQLAPPWGGVGFWLVLVGLVGFYPSALATILVGLLASVTAWRARHGRNAPPTQAPEREA